LKKVKSKAPIHIEIKNSYGYRGRKQGIGMGQRILEMIATTKIF
jgi:hypothetical protein